jgi:hypothetical protein
VFKGKNGGSHMVELRAADLYDPFMRPLHDRHREETAAWFLDTDGDDKTVCLCLGSFPADPECWQKRPREQGPRIAPEVLGRMQAAASFRFRPGGHERIEVMRGDTRSNETVRMVGLLIKGYR